MILTCRYLYCCLLLLLLTGVLGVCNAQAKIPEKGTLLVANEQLADPRFRHQVVLLIQHDAQGTAGLVLNRPSRLPLSAVLPEGSKLADQKRILSYGGPIEPQSLLVLVKVRKVPPEPADEVIDDLYVTGLGVLDDWPDFADEVLGLRAFVGYTGWSPGQLEAEMQRGDWSVLAADEQSVLGSEGGQLWERLKENLKGMD